MLPLRNIILWDIATRNLSQMVYFLRRGSYAWCCSYKMQRADAGFVLDKEDNSVTRSDPYYRELFKKCGLYIHTVKVNVENCRWYLVTCFSFLITNLSCIWNRTRRNYQRNYLRSKCMHWLLFSQKFRIKEREDDLKIHLVWSAREDFLH
jgi:hypothetical protein